MEFPISVRPFLQHYAFDFWRQRFSAVIVPSSLREDLCTPAMHGYWQAVMTSFEQELAGSRDFSLIPPEGLNMVVSLNPRLLLPSKSVLAYANTALEGRSNRRLGETTIPSPSRGMREKP